MGRLDLRPARVRQTVSLLLDAKRSSAPPPWYQAIGLVPPPEVLSRTVPIRHHPPPLKGRRNVRRPSKMFRPQQISYEEDTLRSEFFKDHPWELARPRLILEDDGKDYQRWDWSKPFQAGRPVGGESVIQRQRYLMRQKIGPLTDEALANLGENPSQADKDRALDRACDQARDQAYDQARKEFYQQRHDHEVEVRVAREEALAVGAMFGKDALEVGMELEMKTFDKWKVWAEEQATVMEQARSAAYSGGGLGSSTTEDEHAASEKSQGQIPA